ncbi:uncharacterized protein LOC126320393 isoform X2 [Schistocerca gregaria]|uniref:uncharacterized protein LOC126320393 isoform X2 n=1 Tax=Schistocerca gregaria TaxID=7010 RepID=UPI00211EEB2F|nr:uncharacterized protein LOC126320393 isoform X2 [Schistocerca gregaria]
MKSISKQAFAATAFSISAIILISFFYRLGKLSVDDVALTVLTSPQRSLAQNVEVVSWKPRIFHFHNFLDESECDQIVEIGNKESLKRSMVLGNDGKPVLNPARTSYGAFLSDHKTAPLIKNIARRIEEWTGVPEENGEIFYLLRYRNGEEYKPHMDWFNNDLLKQVERGQRIMTVLMYLSDVELGGETWFPKPDIKVNPKKGDALLFYNVMPTNKADELALHGSLPVMSGTKWSMTRWIRDKKT